MKIRHMRYTKDDGDSSLREVLVISKPNRNYLMQDLTKFSDKEMEVFKLALTQTEEFRDNAMKDFELITGIKPSTLWRTFKPEGIEWIEEDEI